MAFDLDSIPYLAYIEDPFIKALVIFIGFFVTSKVLIIINKTKPFLLLKNFFIFFSNS